MADARISVYHRRATQLASAMRLCQDDLPSYASAAGLLAVHSAISYSDAVLLGLTGSRPRDKDHKKAVPALERACMQAKVDARGVNRLRVLLGAKTDVSYGDRQVDSDTAVRLCFAADQFQRWAENILKQQEGRPSSWL